MISLLLWPCLFLLALFLLLVEPSWGWSMPFLSSPKTATAAFAPSSSFYFAQRSSLLGMSTKQNGNEASDTITKSTNNNENENHNLPYLDQWQIMSDGSVAGTISKHSTFEDGSRIDTSVVAFPSNLLEDLAVDTIITTVTGSQYHLGQELLVELNHWEWTEDGTALQGQVVPGTCLEDSVMKEEADEDDDEDWMMTTTGPIVKKSSDFAIMDTDSTATETVITTGSIVQSESGIKYQLGQPLGLSFPHLDQWKRLDGGSIAGIVTRHDVIPDGELITTSPLVEYDESQGGIVLVRTASGSRYQLGEPESVVVSVVYNDDDDKEEDISMNTHDEEEKEDEIESIATPKAPDMAPPAHIFQQSKDLENNNNNNNNNNHHQHQPSRPPQPPSTPPKIVLKEQERMVEELKQFFFTTPKPPVPPKEIQEALMLMTTTNESTTSSNRTMA